MSLTTVRLGSVTVDAASVTRWDWPEPTGRDVELHLSKGSRLFHWYSDVHIGSPGFWVDQTRRTPQPDSYQVGRTLPEEVALCILGGYGITEAMAFAAFSALRDADLLSGPPPAAEDIERCLTIPISLPGRDRPIRYRFAAQRADRLSRALATLTERQAPQRSESRPLRDWLMSLPGVGPKTASWIVRNLTSADDIAVIDVHIRRAGVLAGVFDPEWRLPRDYAMFEEAFCAWAALGGVRTADLDACIWSQLSRLGVGARSLFGVTNLSDF